MELCAHQNKENQHKKVLKKKITFFPGRPLCPGIPVIPSGP